MPQERRSFYLQTLISSAILPGMEEMEDLGITKIERHHKLDRWLPVEVSYETLYRWLGHGELIHDELHGNDTFSVNDNLFFKIYY